MVVDAISKRPLANAISCIKNSLIDGIKIYYTNDDLKKNPFESLIKKVRTVDKIN